RSDPAPPRRLQSAGGISSSHPRQQPGEVGQMTPQSAWVRNVRGRTGPACLLIASIIGGVPAGAGAGLSPAQRCSIAKDKAAAKKIASKLKCREKAVTLGAPVDPACVAIAESKFDAAIAKAEAFGGCATNGDGATIESAVDSCVDSIATLAFGTTSTTVASATTTTTSTTMPADPVCCAISPSNQVPFSSCTMASG